MSFEKALVRASTLPTVASTRAILWLSGIGDPNTINKKGSEDLQERLSRLNSTITGVKVTPSTIRSEKAGYYVDSIHITENRARALQVLTEATETALLMTFQPAEVSQARLSHFVADQQPWNAWYAMGLVEGSNVTETAIGFAQGIRDRMFTADIDNIFQN